MHLSYDGSRRVPPGRSRLSGQRARPSAPRAWGGAKSKHEDTHGNVVYLVGRTALVKDGIRLPAEQECVQIEKDDLVKQAGRRVAKVEGLQLSERLRLLGPGFNDNQGADTGE